MKNYKAKLDKINTFIFDFDGVLSDGMVLLTENGDFLRRTNVKDGYAIQFAIKKGFRIAIISGAKGKGMEKRLFGLNIEDIYLGVPDKLVAYNNLKEKYNLQDENILYMGDDIPDINVMKQVAVACCPADADSEVKKISHYISDKKGGEGCVRDIIEQTLRLHKLWMNDDAHIW